MLQRPPTKYGIAYTVWLGALKGMTVPVMQHYGFPLLFKDYENALGYARKSFGELHDTAQVRIVSEKYAVSLVRKVVEHYSGRSHEQVTPVLDRLQQNRINQSHLLSASHDRHKRVNIRIRKKVR